MHFRAQLIAVAVCAALSFGAAWAIQSWRFGAKVSELHAQQAQQAADSIQAARDLEQRRVAVVENERDHAINQSKKLARDVAAGRAAAERMRRELDALRARHSGGDSVATERGAGEQHTDTIGLLIDMLTGMDSAGREVAEYADRLRVAGLACERVSDRVRADK